LFERPCLFKSLDVNFTIIIIIKEKDDNNNNNNNKKKKKISRD